MKWFILLLSTTLNGMQAERQVTKLRAVIEAIDRKDFVAVSQFLTRGLRPEIKNCATCYAASLGIKRIVYLLMSQNAHIIFKCIGEDNVNGLINCLYRVDKDILEQAQKCAQAFNRTEMVAVLDGL